MRAFFYSVALHGKEYRNCYIAVVFLLVMGLVCGMRTAAGLGFDSSLQWGGVMGSTLISGQGGVFFRAVFRELRIIVLIGLCGLGLAGIVASGLLVAVRGFIVGFSFGFLAANYGSGGLLIALIAVLPQNLLLLPAILFAAVHAMRSPLIRRWGPTYWKGLLWSVLVCVAGAGVEALLSGLLPGIA